MSNPVVVAVDEVRSAENGTDGKMFFTMASGKRYAQDEFGTVPRSVAPRSEVYIIKKGFDLFVNPVKSSDSIRVKEKIL